MLLDYRSNVVHDTQQIFLLHFAIYSMYMLYYIAWFAAFGATLASICFIEILGNPAAPLCWFERMLMFGLLLTLTVGILKKDKNIKYYALPFIIFGIPSAAFQQLVHGVSLPWQANLAVKVWFAQRSILKILSG